MNKSEFMLMLIRPINELDAIDLHLRRLFKEKNSISILYITGLDFREILEKDELIKQLKS